jgi:hypothetical protein
MPKLGWLKKLKNWNPIPSTPFFQPGNLMLFLVPTPNSR